MASLSSDDTDSATKPIDIDSPENLAWWCSRLDVGVEELLSAISRVGAMPAAVSTFLQSMGVVQKPVLTANVRARFQVDALRAAAAKKRR